MVNDNSLVVAMIGLVVVTVVAVSFFGGGSLIGGAASTSAFSLPCKTFTTEQNNAWHVSWVCDATGIADCDRNDMCSYDKLCYSNDYQKMFPEQKNDKYAVCAGSQGNRWLDADGGQTRCLELNQMFPGLAQWAVGGEKVGEYFNDFDGGGSFPYECCGDDDEEYPVATGDVNTPFVCCNSASDSAVQNSGYWQCI
jgi:hypothetical protein